MQDLKPIRVFLEVAAQQSFVRAANAMHMTPATVTRLVARLEADLGQQLLLRTTRQVSLTSAGALVAARYRPLVAEFDRVLEDLNNDAQPHRGRLSINAPMSFGQRLMPKLAESFRLAYPNIELVLRMTDQLVDIVEEDCDLAIRISGPPQDKSTIWRKVCEIPRYMVASKGFFDLHPRARAPDQLDRRTCLSYAHGKEPETWQLKRDSVKRSVMAGSHLISNNGDFLHAMVRADAGVAVLPEFIVGSDLQDGALEHVLPEWHIVPLWLSLYYPPYEALPPLVATFTDFFEAFLTDIEGFRFDTQ